MALCYTVSFQRLSHCLICPMPSGMPSMPVRLMPDRKKCIWIFLHKKPLRIPSEDTEVLNETQLIDTDGQVYRPDRVLIKDGKVTVIDYKFGEKNRRYHRQVARYADIYRRMGYSEITPIIWYVLTDEVE